MELAGLGLAVVGTLGATCTVSGALRASPSPPGPHPSSSPLATVSPSPAQPVPACATSWVNGDFDGDGRLDTAAVCPLKGGMFSLEVQWAEGAAGAVSLADCEDVCEARDAADFNGDGKDELFLVFSAGASTEFAEVYELPVTEAFGQSPVVTAAPGSPPGFPKGEPTRFDLGGSVTHQGYLTCQTVHSGQQVISTGTQLSDDQTTWEAHETIFALRGSGTRARFVVLSSHHYTVPSKGGQPFVPPGDPCLDV